MSRSVAEAGGGADLLRGGHCRARVIAVLS